MSMAFRLYISVPEGLELWQFSFHANSFMWTMHTYIDALSESYLLRTAGADEPLADGSFFIMLIQVSRTACGITCAISDDHRRP
jgi:hypothetical protein